MSEPKKEGIFKSFKNLPIDSIPKTVLVAVVLCLFCSIVFSL